MQQSDLTAATSVMSEYEQQRLANIARNQQQLTLLGLSKPISKGLPNLPKGKTEKAKVKRTRTDEAWSEESESESESEEDSDSASDDSKDEIMAAARRKKTSSSTSQASRLAGCAHVDLLNL